MSRRGRLGGAILPLVAGVAAGVILGLAFFATVADAAVYAETLRSLRRSQVRVADRRSPSQTPAEFIAFSLSAARREIERSPSSQSDAVRNLGHITTIVGLVLDRASGDVIIVGRHDAERPVVTLDDLVVALRARFVVREWPLVSIDPMSSTKRTGLHRVRYEGGIEDTQLGADLFRADLDLKRIALGILPPKVSGVRAYADLRAADAVRRRTTTVAAAGVIRLWIYPTVQSVVVRDDVASVRGLRLAVFSETRDPAARTEQPTTIDDAAGSHLARSLSNQFDALTRVHPSFARLPGIYELVALAGAIEQLDRPPDLDFWLTKYQVSRVPTRRHQPLMRGRVPSAVQIELQGGVQLRAIALRMAAGDVTALRDAVLITRPTAESLQWRFAVGREWVVPTSSEVANADQVGELFAHAALLRHHRLFDAAIGLYTRVVDLSGGADWALSERGAVYTEKGEFDNALTDLNRALDLNPRSAEAYFNRGVVQEARREDTLALRDYSKTLELNPRYGPALIGRGELFRRRTEYPAAIRDYTAALEARTNEVAAWVNRGIAYVTLGAYEDGIRDFTSAIERYPRRRELGEVYLKRAVAFYRLGDFDKAWRDLNEMKQLGVDPPADFVDALRRAGRSVR